jgi:hypothetical protein
MSDEFHDISTEGETTFVRLINFRTGHDELRHEHTLVLENDVIPFIQQRRNVPYVHMIGKASRRGNAEDNEDLSRRRVQRVRALLIQKLREHRVAMPENRLRDYVAEGERFAFSSDENAAWDRAVEIQITQNSVPTTHIRLPRSSARDRPETLATRLRKLHVWADPIPDWRPSGGPNAQRHVDGPPDEEQAVEVTSIDELKQLFQYLLSNRVSLSAMDFHTHGGAGRIRIGSERLSVASNPLTDLDVFRYQRFDAIFLAGARIELLGCNVAEGPKGELFLAEFGEIFLRHSGGEVKASTGVGFADPIFSGNVAHPTGQWVTARVYPGGTVNLHNHRHLHPQLIRDAIQRLQNAGPTIGPTIEPTNLQLARRYLQEASISLGPDSNRPSYRRVYEAYNALVAALAILRSYGVR